MKAVTFDEIAGLVRNQTINTPEAQEVVEHIKRVATELVNNSQEFSKFIDSSTAFLADKIQDGGFDEESCNNALISIFSTAIALGAAWAKAEQSSTPKMVEVVGRAQGEGFTQ